LRIDGEVLDFLKEKASQTEVPYQNKVWVSIENPPILSSNSERNTKSSGCFFPIIGGAL
jgi:hypothetical protein